MATLSELVETIADVEGLDPATVGLIGRYIREAGLITQRGRGPSAAKMGRSDAANLLIGVNAAKNVVDAARAVTTYRLLTSYTEQPAMKYGVLGEAIEQLIFGAGVGELSTLLGQEVQLELQEAFAKGDVTIALKFRTSTPFASIGIAALSEFSAEFAERILARGAWHVQHVFRPFKRRGPPQKGKVGDRTEEVTIGYPTLRAVGKLIQ
jgi:hypothetical protein